MDFYLLDLKRSIKGPLTNNNITKTNIFTAKFFPKTKIIDFNDIGIFSLAKVPRQIGGLAPRKKKFEFDHFEAYHLYNSNKAFGKPEYCPVR